MFSLLPKAILTASMPKFMRSAILAASIILPIISSAMYATTARAESHCQCVEYVKNRFGITDPMDDAKNMIYSLPKHGFIKIDKPQVGAIAVMQPSFFGANPTYGHVGIIENILPDGEIDLRAANQDKMQGQMFSEYGCYNVKVGRFQSINGHSDISFWVRSNPITNSEIHTEIHIVNFSAKAAPVQIKVRQDPSTKNPPVAFIDANQSISFDAWTYGEVVPDYWTDQPDARWYRIAGTDHWVASAVVAGNAPGSQPTNNSQHTNSNTSQPNSSTNNIHSVNFSAKAAPVQIKIRQDPSTKNPPVGFIEANQPISFDAWTYGEVVPDYWTDQPDARWYRIAGTSNWVSSAVVAGNAPGSQPMP